MIYKKSDFNNCQFNPLADQPMVKAYPRLLEIIDKDWQDEFLDTSIRYMIIVYDPKSPIVLNERDITHRKNIAIELIKITSVEITDQLINSSYWYAPDLITRFLTRFVRSKEWAAICAFETSFEESIKEVIEPISGKNSRERLDSVQKKAAIKEEIEKDIRRLDALYKTFFGEDETLLTTKKRLTPEAIANR